MPVSGGVNSQGSNGAKFTVNLECFQRSPLPEAMCCPVNLCFLPADAMVGVGMHSNPFF